MKTDSQTTSMYEVSFRATRSGQEFNPTFPVEATGFDDAVSCVKEAAELLGLEFRFVHRITA